MHAFERGQDVRIARGDAFERLAWKPKRERRAERDGGGRPVAGAGRRQTDEVAARRVDRPGRDRRVARLSDLEESSRDEPCCTVALAGMIEGAAPLARFFDELSSERVELRGRERPEGGS
jgi:hypothetical protein